MLAGLALGQSPAAPAWLASYPGAHPRIQVTPGLWDSSYETDASVAGVIAHYRKLFETAGLPFHPNYDGVGTAIRGTAPEGDLLILIRRQDTETSVRVDVSARSPELAPHPVPLPAPPVPPPGRERAAREETGREHVQNMEKYDQPMRPPRRPPPPTLVWPPWLVRIDGARLQGEKGLDNVGLKTLQCSYYTTAGRNEIQAFYAGLLNDHAFPVRSQSGSSWPMNLKGWIEASDRGLGEGPGIDIRIEAAPAGDTTRVGLRMTARP